MVKWEHLQDAFYSPIHNYGKTKLKSPKVKIKFAAVRCGRGAKGIFEHLLEFLVSNWSVPKRSFLFGGGVYIEHVVIVITNSVHVLMHGLTVHADTHNHNCLTQQTEQQLSTRVEYCLCFAVTFGINVVEC